MHKITRVILLALALSLPAGAQAPAANLFDALTRQQDFEARRASSSNPDLDKNGDARGIAAGETLVMMDAQGPGAITHIWCTLGSEDLFQGRSLVLRVYYDGNENPSVAAPLGDFFGVGHGAFKEYISLPVTVTSYGRSRTCYWRMPFHESIRVTMTNESKEYDLDSLYWYIDWQKHETLPDDTVYFHAQYRQEAPAKPGRYTVLETGGRGHYVGTVHSAHQMETGWYGEGDDFFWIDGEETPRLKGTGTEDYFNDAWGFREYAAPFSGVPLYEGVFAGDRVTAYRWHITDPIPFKESLRVEFEHRGSVFNDEGGLANFELGGFIERPDWVSSVAFWYQAPPVTFDEPIAPLEKRIPPYRFVSYKDMEYRADPPMLVVPQGPFLAYLPNTPDASIEFDFDVEKAGRYRIDGVFLHGILAGVYQMYLDGKKIRGPKDFVIGNYDPVWVPLDTHKLDPGTHTLRFEGTGERSPRLRTLGPHFDGFGLMGITLLRLEDMEGLFQMRDKLLEKK